MFHALARHHRQPIFLQSSWQSLPHNVLFVGPHSADRFQFRHGSGSPRHVEAHRATDRMPGKYLVIVAGEEEEAEGAEAAKACSVAPQKPYLAAVLFPTYHVG